MAIYEVLSAVAKTWKQTDHFSVGEWINKLVHVHNRILKK